MVHAFSQLMHNKSHEITNLVWPHWQNFNQRGLGLSGSVHEKAHLGLSWLIQTAFKGVEDGGSKYLLIQLVPLSLLEKNILLFFYFFFSMVISLQHLICNKFH